MNRRGFSLIELVIVVIIIGVIAVIAVPRMTRGAHRARENALRQDLMQLRRAIELYRTEHDGQFPTVADFESQMTMLSDLPGGTFSSQAEPGSGIIHGPYLRQIPELPIGLMAGASGVDSTPGAGIGWIYNESLGNIKPNTGVAEFDAKGILLRDY